MEVWARLQQPCGLYERQFLSWAGAIIAGGKETYVQQKGSAERHWYGVDCPWGLCYIGPPASVMFHIASRLACFQAFDWLSSQANRNTGVSRMRVARAVASNIPQVQTAQEWESGLWVCLFYQAKMSPWQRRFQVCPCSLLLACSLAGVAHFLASCAPAARMRSPTNGVNGSWGFASWSFPWACCQLGAQRPAALGPWAGGWLNVIALWRHCRGHDLAGIECQRMAWWKPPWCCCWWKWCQLLASDPKVATSLPEQQLDRACPTFIWDLRAVTVGYNHMDVLELCPAHGQPIQPLRFVAHDLTTATLRGHGVQWRGWR